MNCKSTTTIKIATVLYTVLCTKPVDHKDKHTGIYNMGTVDGPIYCKHSWENAK